MGRSSKPTALAIAADIPNLPAAGSAITREQAVQIAKQVGATMLRAAKAEQKAKREEIAGTVGGQITRVDESVIEQGRRFMARLALISQRKKSGSYGSSSPIDPYVKQMGAILGGLEALMLTDRSIGLFEDLRDSDYEGHPYYRVEHGGDPSVSVGDKARARAREVLAQFTIVDDEAKPKGKRAPRNVTPAPLDPPQFEDDDIDEAASEGMDEEAGDL